MQNLAPLISCCACIIRFLYMQLDRSEHRLRAGSSFMWIGAVYEKIWAFLCDGGTLRWGAPFREFGGKTSGMGRTPHHTTPRENGRAPSFQSFWPYFEKRDSAFFLLCLSEPPHSIYIYYYYGSFIIYIITITREGVITRGSYCWILRRDRRHRANVFTVGSCVTSMCLYFYFKEESRRYETHICGTLVKLCLSFPWLESACGNTLVKRSFPCI